MVVGPALVVVVATTQRCCPWACHNCPPNRVRVRIPLAAVVAACACVVVVADLGNCSSSPKFVVVAVAVAAAWVARIAFGGCMEAFL